jgi:segregation and condensation protein B
MSLKSKLEAVIYASEEPVTLTQLATLFGAEALEWKAEQEAAAAQKAAADAAATAADPSQPAIAEGLEYLELRTEDGTLLEQPGFAVLPATEPEAEPSSDQQAQAPAEAGESGGVASQIVENAEETPTSAPLTTSEVASENADFGEIAPAEAPFDPEGVARRIARQLDRDRKAVLRQLINELIDFYANDDRGIEIREIAGGYRMATKPECHDVVRMFIKSLKPPMKLSLPALETLAVIAYKQPVTAPEVNEIRGVDSSGVFGSLLARKLITTAGRKQVIGRPILYKTTKEFLMRFGLKDVSELPSMDEFEKMASELEETQPAAVVDESAENAAYDAEGDAGPELDEDASEEDGVPQTGSGSSATEPSSDSPPSQESASQSPLPETESNQNTEPAG